MKIMGIEPMEMADDPKVIVTLEEYPHAQPVFPADITPEDLKTQLRAWKVNQDEVDALNANPPEPPSPPDISKLKKLEGETIPDVAIVEP